MCVWLGYGVVVDVCGGYWWVLWMVLYYVDGGWCFWFDWLVGLCLLDLFDDGVLDYWELSWKVYGEYGLLFGVESVYCGSGVGGWGV